MPEGKPRDRSKPESEREIGAAEFLFRDDPAAKAPKSAPKSAAAAGQQPGDVFDLVERPEDSQPAEERPMPPVPAAPEQGQARKPRPAKTAPKAAKAEVDPSELVEQVWTRSAEWGVTLIIVCAWATLVFLVVWYGGLSFGQSFLALVVGAAIAAILSYPILITLERPVRVTPEQAVRDYYTALSHHLPHLRRMWLLLSKAGRTSTSFASYEGFKNYWKTRLAQLREGHASRFTPLVFQVVDFKSEKSAGMSRIDAEFAIKVSVRGKRPSGAIHTFPKRIALVRGPDKMWYLEDGTLNRPPREEMFTDS
jgi:hypothetical protein